jgi:hypothetical protein
LAVASLGFSAQGAVKKVPYPEVKVTVNQAYQPDPTFEKMRRAFAEAVATKDAAALAQLVAPMFLWTLDGQPSDQLDLGRDAGPATPEERRLRRSARSPCRWSASIRRRRKAKRRRAPRISKCCCRPARDRLDPGRFGVSVDHGPFVLRANAKRRLEDRAARSARLNASSYSPFAAPSGAMTSFNGHRRSA